jgi:hypothetical protein
MLRRDIFTDPPVNSPNEIYTCCKTERIHT